MKGLIFAAGLGTRLKPLTDTRPKALVEVGGESLLSIVAKKLIAGGVDNLTVNVHHFARQIEDYVRAHDGFGVKTNLSMEPVRPLETGGGLLNARAFLDGEGSFLVHNVDILSNLDLRSVWAHEKAGAMATLVVSERPSSRHLLFDSEMRLVGWENCTTGEVRSPYHGMDPDRYRRMAFAGIHLVSPRVFAAMESYGFSGAFSIIDFYLRAAADHPIYGYEPQNLRLIDVGKVENLLTAEDFLARYQR